MTVPEQSRITVVSSVRLQTDDGNVLPLALTPVSIGTRTNIVLMCFYSDGVHAPAVNVTWNVPDNVFFVFDYQPTTYQANWVPPLPGPQNPISLIPWFVPGVFVAGAITPATIIASGTDPRLGQPAVVTDVLSVITPNITLSGAPADGDGIVVTPDDRLDYSLDSRHPFDFDMDIRGVPAGGQIVLVQLVDTSRIINLENGATIRIAVTPPGTLWCDFPPSRGTFYSEAAIGNGGPIDIEFADSPEQPLLQRVNGQGVLSYVVQDRFFLFILYRWSPMPIGTYDPNNVWSPILSVTQWGWRATALEDLGNFELDVEHSGYLPTLLAPPFPPVWAGSIPDNVLQNQDNIEERRLRRKPASPAGASP
jgi:hypothetical protein